MEATEQGQVIRSAAEIYDEFFVPALFREWAPRLCDAASLAPGQSVLDVACGTGVLAREAHGRVSPGGTVTGLDRNGGMLEVAQRAAPDIAWRPGMAESLPFDDASFDAVLCQFGLMFFEDRAAAISEMWRVLRPGGTLAVAVWDALENTPGYSAMAGLLLRLFGEREADTVRVPYILGETAVLRRLFAAAGIANAHIATVDGVARFPSIESWVHTDVKGWTLADLIDDAQYQKLLAAAQSELTRFVTEGEAVSFRHRAHLVTATKS